MFYPGVKQEKDRMAITPIYSCEKEHSAIFRAYLFGPFRLFYRRELLGEAVWRRNKAKSLLKWFLLHPGQSFSADQLIDLFWPDLSAETAQGNLHVTLHFLRRLLEPGLVRGQTSSYISRSAGSFYQFQVDATWWADIFIIPHLLHEAVHYEKSSDVVKAMFYYHKIMHYCNLRFLPEDIYEDCFLPYHQQYERLSLRVLSRLIALSFHRHEFDEVVEYAYQALLLDPCHEPAMEAIVKAYHQQGNGTKSMQVLQEFERVLQKKLAIVQ